LLRASADAAESNNARREQGLSKRATDAESALGAAQQLEQELKVRNYL
jgi:hypothetical protein